MSDWKGDVDQAGELLRSLMRPGDSVLGFRHRLSDGRVFVVKTNPYHFGDGIVAFPDGWDEKSRRLWRQLNKVPGQEWRG